eukprot:gene14785-biopygen6614
MRVCERASVRVAAAAVAAAGVPPRPAPAARGCSPPAPACWCVCSGSHPRLPCRSASWSSATAGPNVYLLSTSVHPSVCQSVCPTVHPIVPPPVRPSVRPSVRLSVACGNTHSRLARHNLRRTAHVHTKEHSNATTSHAASPNTATATGPTRGPLHHPFPLPGLTIFAIESRPKAPCSGRRWRRVYTTTPQHHTAATQPVTVLSTGLLSAGLLSTGLLSTPTCLICVPGPRASRFEPWRSNKHPQSNLQPCTILKKTTIPIRVLTPRLRCARPMILTPQWVPNFAADSEIVFPIQEFSPLTKSVWQLRRSFIGAESVRPGSESDPPVGLTANFERWVGVGVGLTVDFSQQGRSRTKSDPVGLRPWVGIRPWSESDSDRVGFRPGRTPIRSESDPVGLTPRVDGRTPTGSESDWVGLRPGWTPTRVGVRPGRTPTRVGLTVLEMSRVGVGVGLTALLRQ